MIHPHWLSDGKIAPNFYGQLRIAADDPNTTPGTMREGMRDAAGVIEGQVRLIVMQQQWIDQLKLQTGTAWGFAITAIVVAGIAIGFAIT